MNPVDQWVGTAGRKLAQYETEREEQSRLNKERQAFEGRTMQRFAELEQRLTASQQAAAPKPAAPSAGGSGQTLQLGAFSSSARAREAFKSLSGRYAYLAAWGAVREKGGTDEQAAEFVAKLYKNVPVLAKGGRDATATFLQRNIGDVLITFESEVVSIDREFGAGKVDSVYPSVSVVAENPVAIVERTTAKKNSGALAKAYLDYLYSEEAQEIAAKHAIRPRSEAVLKKHAATFKPIKQFTVSKYFGSLTEAQKVHFNDGGQFDKIYSTK